MSNYFELGRTLDSNGSAVPGTGVKLNRLSPTAQLLLAGPAVIISNPVTREFGARVRVKTADGAEKIKGLGIIPPGCLGPPKHIHPNYAEEFTVVEGAFDFFMGKTQKRISAGEVVVIPPGIAHTFKPAGPSEINSFLVDAIPPGNLEEVIRTVWALAHEGKTNGKGQPKEFWQGIAIGYELQDDTLFVSPPPFVQRIMFSLLGKTALKKGFRGVYDKYTSDEYWKNKVEQISFGEEKSNGSHQ